MTFSPACDIKTQNLLWVSNTGLLFWAWEIQSYLDQVYKIQRA